MEKTSTLPLVREEPEGVDLPLAEPNSVVVAELQRSSEDSNGDKAHSQEPEHVVEWGGPGGRYGKVCFALRMRLAEL